MKDHRFRKADVFLISISHLTHDIYPAILPALIPFLIDKTGITYAMTGLLFFLLRAPSLLNIFIGIIADRLSTRYFVIFAPAVTAILMSFVPLVDSYVLICVMLFSVGFSSAAYHVPAPVMIKHVSGNKTGTGMSFFMVGGEFARSLGPLMLIGSIELLGYENVYLMMIPGLLSSLFVYFNLKNISIKQDFKKNKNPLHSIMVTWKKMKKLFFIISGMILGRAFVSAAMVSFLPTFMTNRGFSIAIAGSALSVLEMAGVFGAFSSGTLSDKFGRKNLLHLITFLLPLFMLLFLITSGWIMIMMLILLGFLLFAMTPINLALVQDNCNEYPASANSIYMTINFVISSGTALLFGFLGDIISLDKTYYISLAMSLVSIPFVFMLPKIKI